MEHYTPRYTRHHFFAGIPMGAFSLLLLKVFAQEQLRFFESGDCADE